MRKLFVACMIILLGSACNPHNQNATSTKNSNIAFNNFQPRFLDAYWKENPSAAIFAGYGKYYEEPVIPDSASFVLSVNFSKQWLDSLHSYNYNNLSDDNKINYNIIQNQLQSNIWYTDTFKSQQSNV